MAQIIRLQAQDGRWETVGVDRLSRVSPEGLSLSSNEHGSDTARFALKRDPGGIYPDLASFTPCEVEIDGVVVWTGRVWETPTKEGRENSISVEGRGWQYHLDDRAFQFPFLMSRQAANLKDIRGMIFSQLNYFTSTGTVSADDGATIIGWEKGTDIDPTNAVGVYLDFGQNYYDKWYFIEMTTVWNMENSNISLLFRANDDQTNFISPAPADSQDLMPGIPGNVVAPMTTKKFNLYMNTPRRYLGIFLYYSGASGTFSVDEIMKITDLKIFGRAKYATHTDQSALRASSIVKEAIDLAAPQIKSPTIVTKRFQDEVKATPKLKGYWRFAGSGGTQPDDSGNGRNMTVTNGSWSSTRLLQDGDTNNGSMNFNGSTAYAAATLGAGLTNNLSMEMVFQANANQQDALLMYYGNTGSNGFGLFHGNSTSITDIFGTVISANSTQLWVLLGGIGWIWTQFVMVPDTSYHMMLECNLNVDQMAQGASTVYLPAFTLIVNGGQSINTAPYRYMQYFTGGNPPFIPPVIPNAPSDNFLVGGQAAGNKANILVDEVAIYQDPFWGKIAEHDELARLHYQTALAPTNVGSVSRTFFNVPDFPMDQAQTPREVIEAANAFHGYAWKVNHEPTLEFNALPSKPRFEVGRWSGAEFEDASSNSGEEVYNEVRVEATDALGNKLLARRGGLQPSTTITFKNPSATVDASNWAATNGTITRQTSTVKSSPGSFVLTTNASGLATAYAKWRPNYASSDFNGEFTAGRLYRFEAWFLEASASSQFSYPKLRVKYGAGGGTTLKEVEIPYAGVGSLYSFFRFGIDFVCPVIPNNGSDELRFEIEAKGTASSAIMYMDDAVVYAQNEATLPGRRGFTRTKILPINAAMVQEAIDAIGDAYLTNHLTTPFKGTLVHSSLDGVREVIGGRNVHPAEMLNYTTEKINFSHRVDPDTGAWGREGRISTVAYDSASGQSTITIDNTRTNFDAVLSRLSAVIGQ